MGIGRKKIMNRQGYPDPKRYIHFARSEDPDMPMIIGHLTTDEE